MWRPLLVKSAQKCQDIFNNFVIGGPNHPTLPFSFAVLQQDKDYGGQANAPTFAGLRRGKRMIGMTREIRIRKSRIKNRARL
jgi:hypothetical protein